MNLRPLPFTLLAAALLLAAGCSKRASEPPPPQKSESKAAAPEPKPSAKSAAAKPAPKPKAAPAPEPEPEPVPDILFSLRGLDSGQLANDRPLFVGVRVEPSVESAKTLTLAPATGSWSHALKVELAAAAAPGKVLLEATQTDDDAPASVDLSSGTAVEGTWYFPSSEIAKLAPGDYVVTSRLAIPDGAGWHGNVAGEPAAFTLIATSTDTTPEKQAQRAVALAGEAMLAKDWQKAAQLLDERLTTDPDNIDLLKVRAALCLQGDNPLAANVCVNRCWARVARENWTHPPADLYVLTESVMAAMARPRTGAAPSPASWSTPPSVVLTPLAPAAPAPAKQ